MPVYAGDQTRLKIQILDVDGGPFDLTGATLVQIKVKYPTGLWAPFVGEVLDPPSEGWVRHVTTQLEEGANFMRGRTEGLDPDPISTELYEFLVGE